jgi:hypothetical protein
MNYEFGRCQAQHDYDELLQQQRRGLPVSLSQIQAADQAFTDAANRENAACLSAELGVLRKGLAANESAYFAARSAMRTNLHMRDELVEQGKRLTLLIEAKHRRLKAVAARIEELENLMAQLPKQRPQGGIS